MRRIQPPKCSICNQRTAVFESDVWPTLKLCNDCWRAGVEFIIRSSYDHGNPLLLELIEGTDNGEDEHRVRVWRQRPNESSTFYEYWVRRDSDSQNKSENPLDILDQLCLESRNDLVISPLPMIPGLLTGLDE